MPGCVLVGAAGPGWQKPFLSRLHRTHRKSSSPSSPPLSLYIHRWERVSSCSFLLVVAWRGTQTKQEYKEPASDLCSYIYTYIRTSHSSSSALISSLLVHVTNQLVFLQASHHQPLWWWWPTLASYVYIYIYNYYNSQVYILLDWKLLLGTIKAASQRISESDREYGILYVCQEHIYISYVCSYARIDSTFYKEAR